jgi:PadR family transcriptional regulator, regulatory protein AphA
MSSERPLTPTSYIVLGLLELLGGEATPYELKRAAATSVGNLWSLHHAQLYGEPERLAVAGLVSEQREQTGRRRRRYSLTTAGRAALHAWREQPTDAFTELRDPGLLQLFFGADPRRLANVQLAVHERRLGEYEELMRASDELPHSGPLLALQAGIGHEREWVRFWRGLTEA